MYKNPIRNSEPLTSWTLLPSLFFQISADLEKKWGQKCSTGQSFICTKVISYKIHILPSTNLLCIIQNVATSEMRLLSFSVFRLTPILSPFLDFINQNHSLKKLSRIRACPHFIRTWSKKNCPGFQDFKMGTIFLRSDSDIRKSNVTKEHEWPRFYSAGIFIIELFKGGGLISWFFWLHIPRHTISCLITGIIFWPTC